MSKWRDSLLPGSFRGVPFFTENSSTPVGRRGQLHEYPQRDEPFFEPLGKEAQVHKLTAFVVGDDVFDQRDKLLEALEKDEGGELVHPWLGRMQVQAGACSMAHERREGGVVRFELTFYPDRPRTYPRATANTQRQVDQASEGVLDSALGRYSSAMAKIDAARINALALRNGLSGVFGVLQSQFSPLTSLYRDVSGFVDSVINAPGSLASSFSSFFSGTGIRTGSRGSVASSATTSSGSASSLSGPTYRDTLAVTTQQVEAVAAINTVPQTSGRDTGAAGQATADLVQDALLVQIGQQVAEMPVATAPVPVVSTPTVEQQVIQPVERPEVPVADDVIDLRDQLDAAIWDASMKAPPEHYTRLNTLRQGLVRHLDAVAASGVRLQEVTPVETLPALVLAYQRFGDSTRSGEVVQRNRITHPGFVPPLPLKVAQE